MRRWRSSRSRKTSASSSSSGAVWGSRVRCRADPALCRLTPSHASAGPAHEGKVTRMADTPESSCLAVSVIIPCRQEGGFIESCLRGVLAFEAPPGGFEVLVVDGMSTDGTRDAVARIAAEDPRVRLLDNPQRITPVALNIGIR